jgi:hypothetical protein
MAVTRRDALKALSMAPALAAAPVTSGTPIVPPAGGTRLYPSWASPQWWTAQPIINKTWTYPSLPNQPAGFPVTGGLVSLGASIVRDDATSLHDTRNTPTLGPFTRAYFQMATRPLLNVVTLSGSVSAAIHCIEWHRKHDAVLALQVVVHRDTPTGPSAAEVLRVTRDTNEFTLGNPPTTRAAVAWPIAPYACVENDVIAINIGIYCDNQSKLLAEEVGFHIYANQAQDITFLDSSALANTWVDFSTLLPL